MTEKQRAAIEKHGRRLLVIFPKAKEQDPVALCKKLKRLESEAHRFALRCCNGPNFESEDEADDLSEALLLKVLTILGEGPKIWLNRDARGYALKIDEQLMRSLLEQGKTLHTDWGGNGIIAPEINADGV